MYVTTAEGGLFALDSGSGEEQWSTAVESGRLRQPVYADSRVYALDKPGVLHAFETA